MTHPHESKQNLYILDKAADTLDEFRLSERHFTLES